MLSKGGVEDVMELTEGLSEHQASRGSANEVHEGQVMEAEPHDRPSNMHVGCMLIGPATS